MTPAKSSQHSMHFGLDHSHCYCWRQSSWIIQQLFLNLCWQEMAILIRGCSVIHWILNRPGSCLHVKAQVLSPTCHFRSSDFSQVLSAGFWLLLCHVSRQRVDEFTGHYHTSYSKIKSSHSPKRFGILMVSTSWKEKALRKWLKLPQHTKAWSKLTGLILDREEIQWWTAPSGWHPAPVWWVFMPSERLSPTWRWKLIKDKWGVLEMETVAPGESIKLNWHIILYFHMLFFQSHQQLCKVDRVI